MMKAWEDLLSQLENELGVQIVTQWLRPIRVERFDAGNVYLEATPFQRSWFEEHVPKPNLKNNNQRPIKIHWISARSHQKNQLQTGDFQISSDPLEPGLCIENFIHSSANRMAAEMAREVCETDAFSFNPIYISGPSGSGKTHLLTGMALSLSKKGKKVFFINAETFTGHVVQAIRLGRMLEFRKAYRDIDCLIVDDVHLLARRAATQEEFFHTFNALHTMQRLIILSSSEPTSQLKEIEPRLISRFEWGITLNLTFPEPAALKEILEEKSRQLQLNVSSELLEFLIRRFSSKPTPSIEALHAIALRSPKNHNLNHIEKVLADLLEKESHSVLSFDKIIQQTAVYFGIRAEDITGSSQQREYTQPRQIAMFLCRDILGLPFQGIGRLFNRDHSTVMTSVKQIQKAIESNSRPIRDPLEGIVKKLALKRTD
jgi:chromosomal replication initiator protein